MLVPSIALVVIVYGVLGGLTAAYWTDLAQGIFIILLSVLLIPYGLWALVQQFGDPSTMGLIGIVVQPHFIATGGGSAKSENEARIGLVVGNFLKRLCTVGWAITVLIALAVLAGNASLVANPDHVWGVAAREILGPLNLGLVGLMLARPVRLCCFSCCPLVETFSMSVHRFGWLLCLVVTIAASPAEADQPVVSRVLFGSCIKQNLPAPIFGRMIEADPGLLIFLGDNIYADTSDMGVMERKYAQLSAMPQFAELRRRCPVLATWDDHDFGINDGGAEFSQREAAEQVFLDFWQDPADSPRRKRPGVYEARVFGPPGQRLQVILLDTRYFRSPLLKGERQIGGPYIPDPDPNKTMLGEAQWKWFEEQLRAPAEVRLIASSIQFVAEASGQETWSNLPAERQRMIDTIRRTSASGVLFISGDRHWSEISAIREGVPYVLYDITSSSFNQKHPRGTPTDNRYRISDTTCHVPNFGVLEIDWQKPAPSVTAKIVREDGAEPLRVQIEVKDLQRP